MASKQSPTTAIASHRLTRFVLKSKFCEQTGYTPKSIESKIAAGVWIEGFEFSRAPDGHTLINVEGYERWVQNLPRSRA